MKLDPGQRVPIQDCKSRALAYLKTLDRRVLAKANAVAIEIWPDHQMTSQGAGAAASRILRQLQKEGLVRWDSSDYDWGYRISTKGRADAE